VTVILPWAMMIHLREPDYWRHFIFVEHFNRFTAIDIHSFHPQPFWIFLPYLIGGAIPWTFAAPAAIRGVRKAGWRDPLIRYALCWLLFPFLLLSASKGKLGTYILPCFAPLSLLFAVGLAESMKKQDSRPFRVAAWTSATVAGLAATVIAAMSFLNLTSRPIFASDETWKWGAGSAALAAWCGISIASARAKRMAMGLGLFAVVPVALMLSAHFILPKWATWSRTPETFVARYAEAIGPEDQVYSTSNLAPAVGWVLKRNDIGILGRGGELEYGLNYPDARNRQIRGVPELLVQINDRTRTRVLILVIDDEQYSDNLEDLPGATRTDKADGFVFARYDRYLDTPKTR
jgi:4-amino-4-deoxy-L-arabinose transferase